MAWIRLDTEPQGAAANMLFDKQLLESLQDDSPCILHFYEWEKSSITYGYFIQPDNILDMNELQKLDIDCARRPTGGGIVFHLWDIAFSVLLPEKWARKTALENYALINQAVLQAISSIFSFHDPILTEYSFSLPNQEHAQFCMAAPTKYDVILNGKKMAGAAQRRCKQGLLHQGTIALSLPPKEKLFSLVRSPDLAEAIYQHTYPVLQDASEKEIQETKHLIKHVLEQKLIEGIA